MAADAESAAVRFKEASIKAKQAEDKATKTAQLLQSLDVLFVKAKKAATAANLAMLRADVELAEHAKPPLTSKMIHCIVLDNLPTFVAPSAMSLPELDAKLFQNPDDFASRAERAVMSANQAFFDASRVLYEHSSSISELDAKKMEAIASALRPFVMPPPSPLPSSPPALSAESSEFKSEFKSKIQAPLSALSGSKRGRDV